MTASNCLYLIVIGLVLWGGERFVRSAESSSSASTGSSSQGALAPDGTPVVHKSSHKKRPASSSSSTSVTAPPVGTQASSATVVVAPKTPPTTLAVTAPATTAAPAPASTVPTVETGLPVARHSDLGGMIGATSVSMTSPGPGSLDRSPISTPLLPLPTPGGASSVGNTTITRTVTTSSYTFSDYAARKPKNVYPWKTGIYTTMFYIGEGATSISSTDNKSSSFDENWIQSNHGIDNPNDRNGFASGSHASTVNPFYVALPFNDLVYPDKARRWLPPGWRRPAKDGKPVSACKDRWVEIKMEDGSGRVCYAQWEDVGPLRYDHAEYVFGSEKPDTYTRAGLDVSPAVAQYLGLSGQKRATTRWRFVDDEDVPPGQWLKLDEQAVIYDALHHRNANPPIQRASEPVEDSNAGNTKKKIGAAKG